MSTQSEGHGSGAGADASAGTGADVPEALTEVARRHSQVKEAMAQLRDALAAVPIDPDTWLQRVSDRLAALREAFDRHVAVHEGHDSFLAGVPLTSPDLVPQVTKLYREHGHIDALITDANGLLDSAREHSVSAVDDVRSRCDDLLHGLEQHRRRGSQLVWDAFNRDLGGEH